MMAISYVSNGDEKIDKAANPQKVKYHTHTKSHADTSEISWLDSKLLKITKTSDLKNS